MPIAIFKMDISVLFDYFVSLNFVLQNKQQNLFELNYSTYVYLGAQQNQKQIL